MGCGFIIDISAYSAFAPSGPLVGRQEGEVLSGLGAAAACMAASLHPRLTDSLTGRLSGGTRTSPCRSCNSSPTSVSQRRPIIN